jgi:hypothetical protein
MRPRVRIGNLGSLPRVQGAPAAHARTMEVIVEIPEGTDGRLAGTVQAADSSTLVDFSGNVAFLAAIQHLCRGVEPIDAANRLTERKTND